MVITRTPAAVASVQAQLPDDFPERVAEPVGAPTGGGSAVGGQPGREIVGALEIEQGFRQGLELLQRHGLNAGGGGFAQGAAAAGELAESDAGGLPVGGLPVGGLPLATPGRHVCA